VIAGFVASAVLAILFVWQERRASQPMLPLSLFGHRMFALASLVGLLVNVAFYGLILVFSLYFQRVNGMSPFATGLAFVPMMGAVLPVNLVASRVAERFGAPATIAAGAALAAFGCLALLGIAHGTSYWATCAQLIVIGAGLGLLVPPLNIGAARKRREVTLRHRRRRAQRDQANRQRAGCRAVRLADRSIRRLSRGCA
jgi:DHA2 family methylenomycin A resistance protein-like MFS transporter